MFRPTPLNPEYVLRASLLHFTGIKIAASETKKLPSFLTEVFVKQKMFSCVLIPMCSMLTLNVMYNKIR